MELQRSIFKYKRKKVKNKNNNKNEKNRGNPCSLCGVLARGISAATQHEAATTSSQPLSLAAAAKRSPKPPCHHRFASYLHKVAALTRRVHRVSYARVLAFLLRATTASSLYLCEVSSILTAIGAIAVTAVLIQRA
ncbi:hypothetical protein E2542_SST29614 [Spatholobus suberectus]|nr:hypothetical protein E2542_SST29614 [Spatholobus suberectus]